MALFTYVGGADFDGTDLPVQVFMFGIQFEKDVPVDFDALPDVPEYLVQHAFDRLQNNKFFTHIH